MTERFDTTPVRLSDRRFLEGQEFTLDSDAVHNVDVYGRYFLVRSANEEFEMRVNGGQWFLISQGEGFDIGDDDRFNKLSFRRPRGSNATISVKARTSDCHMFDARLSIVRDPNHLQIIQMFPAPSYAVRPMPETLTNVTDDDGNLLVLPGILEYDVWPCYPAAGWLYMLPEGITRAQRKSLRIESSEALNLLWWNGEEDDIGDGVKVATAPMPGTTIPLYEETSQDFVLENATGAVANISILALFDYPVWYSATSEEP